MRAVLFEGTPEEFARVEAMFREGAALQRAKAELKHLEVAAAQRSNRRSSRGSGSAGASS
jgi:hypothetical protein